MLARTMVWTMVVGCSGAEGDGGGEPPAAPPYVLVHGAWMGGWVWDDVVGELTSAGAAVDVVELPAHGDDPTAPGDATLASYVDAVVSAVDAAGEPVILVGHSLGGFPISGAAEQRPDGVARLLYVAAYLPRDGEVLGGLAAEDTGSLVGPNLVYHADGTVGVPLDELGPVFCGDCSPEAVAALGAHYRDEPGMPFGEPIALSAAGFGSVPRSYVFTEDDRAVTPALQRAMVDASPVEAEWSLPTGHTPQLSAPADLAATLLDAR